MATNFHLAPPTKTVDGFLTVAIDIQSIQGSIVFNGNAQTGTADVTLTYTVGDVNGYPVFDCRQLISQAWLDGSPYPVNQLASHDFGLGAASNLRIIESMQAAGSIHTLRVMLALNNPQSDLSGSYPPVLEWLTGPRLHFRFGFSDLYAGRYLESWLPANLIFDQYSIQLDISIINTLADHSVITNGQTTLLGPNHWSIQFPDRFSALSPLLEIHATDRLNKHTDTLTLPVSGKTITIEAYKLSTSTVNLVTQTNNIKTYLIDNENDYGSYIHENRFVSFFNGGGMEYEGGTTTGTGPLLHETFHSWFARGVKPASQSDGWWDEAFTEFHDDGANDAIPFDFLNPPITLCSRNPWQRTTPLNAYTDGNAFWKGMAAMLGTGDLNTLMGDFYRFFAGKPVSTAMLEEFLLCKSGNAQVVDTFHRFVYGFDGPLVAPKIWLKDHISHSGVDQWDGAFWDSPDLWVRNTDDNGTIHQSPEYGQDNWFYARIRNDNTGGIAKHFMISFNAKSYAGTEFVYPQDFLPCIAAKAEFDLAPGEIRIVKSKWPRNRVPRPGTHSCLLAALISKSDHPTPGLHVWEHNNLAQKNLTVVDLQANSFIILPFVLLNLFQQDDRYELEIWRDKRHLEYEASLIHLSKKFFSEVDKNEISTFDPYSTEKFTSNDHLYDCGGKALHTEASGKSYLLTSNHPELIAKRFPKAFEVAFRKGEKAEIPVRAKIHQPVYVALKVSIPKGAKKNTLIKSHLVQRHTKTKKITGGIAVEVRVV